MVRTTLPPAALASTIGDVVRAVHPAVPVTRLREMEGVFAESIRRPRLLAQLLTLFSILALLLAALGIYGVLASMVAERRREIGVRLALGANRARLLAYVMSQGLLMTAIGAAVGLAAALGSKQVIGSFLFGLEPTDPAMLGAVMATLAIVTAFACWLPAWRASRLDPNLVLRTE